MILYYDLVDIRSGMKKLAGGVDKTILMSFPYKSQLYYIVSDREMKECYVAIREKALLKKVQTITKLQFLSMYINALLTEDGHYAAQFSIREENRLRSGYIDIFENVIKIYLCE